MVFNCGDICHNIKHFLIVSLVDCNYALCFIMYFNFDELWIDYINVIPGLLKYLVHLIFVLCILVPSRNKWNEMKSCLDPKKFEKVRYVNFRKDALDQKNS